VSRSPGLYIHVPFCALVCPYCDFAVQTGGPRKREAFTEALVREIGAARWSFDLPFDTIYLGGGTPSSLTIDALEHILAAARDSLPVHADPVIALEANPEDVTTENLQAWKDLGVGCLSLGVQSLDVEALETLGRAHTPEQAGDAASAALASGIEVVSIDLIYGVPGQSAESWQAGLQEAIELRPQHLSCYELTVHEGTRFYRSRQRGDFVEVADDDKATLFFETHRFLADAGYPAYEVSNFARAPEYRSRHNQKYWDHSPYLGVGPSAHSFDGTANRWWNERRLDDWIAAVGSDRPPIAGAESLVARDLILEALALGFRTATGVDMTSVEERYGVDLAAANAELLDDLTETGFLEDIGLPTTLTPTLEGMAIADTLAASFRIPDGS